MSSLATVTFAWAAIYAYLCVFYVLLYARARSAREYLSFGLMAASVSLYCVGNGIYVQTSDPTTALLAVRIGDVGLFTAFAFYVEFLHQMLGRKSRVIHAAYAYAGLGLVLQAFNLFLSDHATEPLYSWGPAIAFPSRTWVGQAYLVGAFVFPNLATVAVLSQRGAAQDAPLGAVDDFGRWVVRATVVGVFFAGGHDVLVRSGYVHAPALIEHSGMFFGFAMSHYLLDRFVAASDELSETTLELGRMYEELQATQERLVRKEQLAAVGELSAVIAHEVRNPLAIIKNAVSGLRREGLASQDRRTLLDILDEETDRLNRLVHDLLAYARPVVPRGRSLPVRELLRRSVERARGGVTHEEVVHVVYELCDELDSVYGDPELLRHALVNVMENAMQAMSAGGTLTIRTEPAVFRSRTALALSFIDTGEGMDTLVRAKARDPFFTTRPSGTGLGLAIVERVVRNHGGEVSIDSRHGEGTTITFLLPVDAPSMIPLPPPGERREGRNSDIRLPRASSNPPASPEAGGDS